MLRGGYEVKIVDSTITPRFQQRVIEELQDALCLAVSLVTGPMIRETVQVAREVKRRGAAAFVTKGSDFQVLLDALRPARIMRGSAAS